jgi:hypothetical protein
MPGAHALRIALYLHSLDSTAGSQQQVPAVVLHAAATFILKLMPLFLHAGFAAQRQAAAG